MQRYSHPLAARRIPLALQWLVSRPPAHAGILILLAADLAALGDVITGPDVWFGPIYLLVICLSAWSSGSRAGITAGLGCMALTVLINGAALYPFAHAGYAWNLASRVGAIAIIVVIVGGSRNAYLREWWLARTDPLTGAFNRQAFFELGDELARESSWRLLIYADLDGLKKVNDLQGHEAGDCAIRDFASAVRQSIRRTDLFARVGGDEFVVFMPVRDRPSAEAVASRVHRTINGQHGSGHNGLRCSVGALIVPPGEEQIDHLVRSADMLMYQAKQQGANMQLTVSVGRSRPSGRARKASTMPQLGSATRQVLTSDRRGLVFAAPPARPVAHPSRSDELQA